MTHDKDRFDAQGNGLSPGAVASWLVMSVVAVAALSLTGAYVPARIKLLGLFAPACGLLAGWIVGQLARQNSAKNRRLVSAVSLVLLASGLVGMTIETHRRRAVQIRYQYGADPKTAMLLHVMQNDSLVPHDDDSTRGQQRMQDTFQLAAQQRKRRLEELTSLNGYLKHRVSPLGEWPFPWPAVFWAGEVFAGSIAGAWLAGRLASSKLSPAKSLPASSAADKLREGTASR